MQDGTRGRRTKWGAVAATALAMAALTILGRSTAAAQEFRVSPIEARFFQPQQMTEYEVLVTAPAGSKLTYTWSGANCGTWSQPDPQNRPNFFRWIHPHPPCDPTTDHKDRTIVVVVSDGKVSFNCTYQGAASGFGPACTTQQTTTTAAGATVTTAPVTTTPVDEEPDAGGGGGGLAVGLGALGALALAGGGYFVYTRSRAGTVSVSDWERLRYQEQVAQEAVLGDFKTMLNDVNGAWSAYRKAVDTFRMRYNLALSASSEMQGLLVEWAEVRGIAQKQDLAFAIVTLLWSGGSLALRGARWLRGGQAAAATTEAAAGAGQVAATTAEAAGAVGQGAKTVGRMEFFGKYIEMVNANQLKNLARMAEEAGMTMAEATARWGDDATDLGIKLSELLAQQRGWVTMAVEAEATVGRVLVNGRAAIAGRGAMSAQDVAQIQQWAARPGFWERLAKAAGHMDEIGWMGERPEVHEFIGLLYNADDIAFLKRVVEAGGDLSKLRAAVGPAQAAVLGSMDATLASVVVSAPSAVATGQAANLAAQAMSDPIAQLGDLTNFVDQFGVTGKIKTMSLPGFVGSELWALVSSPFETYQRHRMTHEAFDQYEQFIKDHASTLGDMSTALDDSVRAMERMQRALNRAAPGDMGSRLRQRAEALRDVLRKMRDAQAGHGGEFEERRAHIEQKLAQIEHVSTALGEMQQRIDQMLEWLKTLQTDPSGGHRSLFEMMNPEIGVRLVSAQTFLDLAMAQAYRGGPGAPAQADPPPTPPPAPMRPYETPPPRPSMTDEEIDRLWEERVREHEERVKRWEEIPESDPIPDAWFRHLDDPVSPPADRGDSETPSPRDGAPR